jgi:hypothetical protein
VKRSPLTRTTALPARKTRITPKKRTAEEKQRIYGDDSRIAWMKRQPCLLAGKYGHQCLGSIQCAHTENGGMGRKADAETTVPLCHAAHLLLHAVGQQSFQTSTGLDLRWEAARTHARWLAEGER